MSKLAPIRRLPLSWPGERPSPMPGSPGTAAYVAALGGGGGARRLPGQLDPVAVPYFRGVPAGMRLALLDRFYRLERPDQPEVIDRFIESYLLLAERGFLAAPGRGRRLAGLATLRALELMHRLFQQQWARPHSLPVPWWQRFMATFRAAGEARLFPVRGTGLVTGRVRTPMREATDILLRSVANPFAWEPELTGHLDRLLTVLSEEVLLFPAASPSAYARNRSGRFVVDATGQLPPAPPEGLPSSPPPLPEEVTPRWWVIDAGPALARLAELRRSLSLGVPAAQVHPVLAAIPPSSRRVLLDRLHLILGRGYRPGASPPDTGEGTWVVTGLEQAVRHTFAHRWSEGGTTHSLTARARLQNEMGTRAAAAPHVQEWLTRDTGRNGLRLRRTGKPTTVLTGHAALILPAAPDGEPVAALVRWQRHLTREGVTEIGLERLKGAPEDCWCQVGWRGGASLQEHPALLLRPDTDLPELVCPAGLFQPGGTCTIRTDNRTRSLELLRLREAGVHFERIEVRIKR